MGINKQNIDIQTDQFVEELTDKAPNYEIGCQTEFIIERPVIGLVNCLAYTPFNTYKERKRRKDSSRGQRALHI